LPKITTNTRIKGIGFTLKPVITFWFNLDIVVKEKQRKEKGKEKKVKKKEKKKSYFDCLIAYGEFLLFICCCYMLAPIYLNNKQC
jgi:hypothetical protein